MKNEITIMPLEYGMFGVGGGAMTNTFVGRYVITKEGSLKPAVFIRTHGDLSCSQSQAFVNLEIGDVISKKEMMQYAI